MNCKFCNKPLSDKRIKEGGKFCDKNCYGKWMVGKPAPHPFEKGHKSWNKDKKMSAEFVKKNRESHIGQEAWNKGKKCPQISGENNYFFGKRFQGKNAPSWKGDKTGYHAMHKWIYKMKGKPKICEHCGKTAKYWANKDHRYTRNPDDYISLCASCHRIYDLKNNPNRLS